MTTFYQTPAVIAQPNSTDCVNARSAPQVSVSLGLADGSVVAFPQVSSGAVEQSRCGDIQLQTTPTDVGLAVAISRVDGQEMDVEYVAFSFHCPMLNFSKVVLPDSGREYMFKDKALMLRSAQSGVSGADIGHAFASLLDQAGQTAFSFGVISHLQESTCKCSDPLLSARKAMVGGHDRLVLTMRVPTEGWRYGKVKTLRESLFLSAGDPSWFHALRRYTKACATEHGVVCPPIPAGAWTPTWCTWTAFGSDEMTPQRILENTKIAADLGIGSIIIDDGWFGPGLDTDDKPLNLGDYDDPHPAKCGDLAELVQQIQALGSKALLWYAPPCVASTSRVYAKVSTMLIENDNGPVETPAGFFNLCPCHPAARKHMVDQAALMMDTYGNDGFKLDLFNTLSRTPCTSDHDHDMQSVVEGVQRTLAEIQQVVNSRKPEGLIELKQNYGNVVAAQYGTMVRAGDTAYDVDTNLARCAYIQTYAKVVHNDYLAASIHDQPRDLAMMLIKQIAAGVPTFSLDLPRQPQSTLDVFREWLALYRQWLPTLQQPRQPQDSGMTVWEMADADTAVIAAVRGAADVRLPSLDTIYLLNASERSSLYLKMEEPITARVESYDHLGQLITEQSQSLSDGDRLQLPLGGYAQITRVVE